MSLAFLSKRRLGMAAIIIKQGAVKVSTGVLKPEKLSAGDASNRKIKTNAEDNLAYAA